MKRLALVIAIVSQVIIAGTALAEWSAIDTATLVSRNWDDNDAFIFATGTVVQVDETLPPPADFSLETNIFWLGSGVGYRNLGAGTLENTTTIPTTGYTAEDPFEVLTTGVIYSFKLTDGTYGVLEFTSIAAPVEGTSYTQCEFKYKIYTPECSCIDTDSDGVIDLWDQCPDTPAGDPTDSVGCTKVRAVVIPF